ncbi:MAG: selenide, water dikinase SelD [Gammaproteobacteria bacterium]
MQKSDALLSHDLLLLGGGHTHALVLLRWAMQPVPGVRLTLVSENSDSPYSGMLPGLVAGHYQRDDVHIDLRRLCRHAGVRFIHAQVDKVDPHNRQVLLKDRPPLSYDTLSINVGATPDLSVPGAAQFSIPVKPISGFWPAWQQQRDQLLQAQEPADIAVVGGGAGSVELVLAMAYALRKAPVRHRLHLVTRGERLLPGYPALMLRWLLRRLHDAGITLHLQADITRVDAHQLSTADGRSIPAHTVFWCTQARAAGWLADSGFDVTTAGFVRVQPTLQTLRWPNIFAAGDCAWIDATPTARAGVYAVRQAPVLDANLRRHLQQQPLESYRPQRHFLSLLATGDRDAVGARGIWPLAGRWVWRWKDRIDRRFMAMLQQLPVLPPPQQSEAISLEPPSMRCGGCGGKVGADVLQQALAGLNGEEGACALPEPDDAAVIALSDDPAADVLVQSVDVLKPLLDDPWLTGRITTLHALSDLYAMHARPHSVQVQVQVPVMAEALQVRDLQQLLQGVQREVERAGARLLGGHTLEADTLQLGLTVNGLAQPGQLLRKRGVQVGDALILTKPIGSGALFAAAMRGAAHTAWIDQAIPLLLQSNQAAADILFQHAAHALTDITGFGLVGHLLEMLRPDGLGAQLTLERIPLLTGAEDCAVAGYHSTLAPANRRARHQVTLVDVAADDPRYTLLFDPQTQGGLLGAIPSAQAQSCIQALTAAGYQAAIIGECTASPGVQIVTGQ